MRETSGQSQWPQATVFSRRVGVRAQGRERPSARKHTGKTHHQQLDLVNQRGRCKELVDGRQYFPFQRGSASGVSSLRASGPDVRLLAGTGQQLPAVLRPEIPLLQLFPRALAPPFLLPCAPHPQRFSRSARVCIKNRRAAVRLPDSSSSTRLSP